MLHSYINAHESRKNFASVCLFVQVLTESHDEEVLVLTCIRL